MEKVLDTAESQIRADTLYFDPLDRPVYEYREQLNGTSLTTRLYDALGRVTQEYFPWFRGGASNGSATITYDLLGRPTAVARPVNDSDPTLQTTTLYYEGLTVRSVDPLGKESTQITTALGALARSIDHDGYYQTFDSDAFGNVLRVTDSLANTLQANTYNLRGMRTAQSDMDAGGWSYTPNALGEIVSQTDAKGQQVTLQYDPLGRLTSRVEAEGTSTWTWGTSATAHNIGRLASLAGPGYSENYVYDPEGRLQTRTIGSDATYAFNYAYNSLGALDTLTYPVSTSSYRLTLKYEYQNGYLQSVRDDNAPSTLFWQRTAWTRAATSSTRPWATASRRFAATIRSPAGSITSSPARVRMARFRI